MDTGVLLGGKYRLDDRLGRGAMGEVWAGKDLALGRPVAVKVILAGLHGSDTRIARLRNEARVAAALQHPGITVVHDIGEHEGHPFFVMELLDGTDFQALVSAWPGGLPLRTALRLAEHTAEALAYAHRKGVVHRDIKPANLVALAEGEGVKICDFGISRYAEASIALTQPGSIMGTPLYMAPEQYEAGAVDGRTDLYSLGCTLMALLTGEPPFTGPTPSALMHQHLTVTPPRSSERREGIPKAVDDLVARLLAKRPDDRPATAEEVARELRAASGLLRTPPRPRKEQAAPPPRKEAAARMPSPPPPTQPDQRTVAATAVLPAGSTAFSNRAALWLFALGLGAFGLGSWLVHPFVDREYPAVGSFGKDLPVWGAFVCLVISCVLVFAVVMAFVPVRPSRRRRLANGAVLLMVGYPAVEIFVRTPFPWYGKALLLIPYVLYLCLWVNVELTNEPGGKSTT